MASTKVSGLAAVTSLAAADTLPVVQAATSKKVTASQIRQFIGTGLNNASAAAVSAAYAADTYLAGSAITIPTAGGWVAGSRYRCEFDMVKTAAGTAAFTITVRMGTLGTTGDGSVLSLAFAAGTAAADTGWFDLDVVFRSVGAGTSAVVAGIVRCTHNLAATGMTTTGSGGTGTFGGVSAGFNSTTQTIIGLSINGGASFSGTNSLVFASLDKYQ